MFIYNTLSPKLWKRPFLAGFLIITGGIGCYKALLYFIQIDDEPGLLAKALAFIPFFAFLFGLLLLWMYFQTHRDQRIIKKTLSNPGSWLLHFIYADSEAIITAKGYFNTNTKNHQLIDKSTKEVEYGMDNVSSLIGGDYVQMALPKVTITVNTLELNPQYLSFRKSSLDFTYHIPGKYIQLKIVKDDATDVYTDTEVALPIPDNIQFNEDTYNAFLQKLNGQVPFYSLIVYE
jgi:hypothetical protein